MLINTEKNEARLLNFDGYNRANIRESELGFSLIELLVGLVIGMMVTLVIMQVFSVFEGQKRSTTGTADAQTNGNIALYNIQRDIQIAGFGLPTFDKKNSPFKCIPSPTYDDPDTPIVEDFDMFPITIIDGGSGSDQVTVRYGDTTTGGISTKIATNPTLPTISVDNNMGCKLNDVVMIVNGSTCAMTKASAISSPDTTKITVAPDVNGKVANAAKSGASLSCLGNWNSITYGVNNGGLVRNGELRVTEVVDIQAQYGVSDAASNNKVTTWVDATGGWSAGGLVNDRNRIKAVRVAIVARNGLLEKDNVTSNPPVAWVGTVGSPAPIIDLTGIPDWQRYRYRVYETIVPVRNMIWSKNTLE